MDENKVIVIVTVAITNRKDKSQITNNNGHIKSPHIVTLISMWKANKYHTLRFRCFFFVFTLVETSSMYCVVAFFSLISI